MSEVKKVFGPLFAVLESNTNKKVKEILDELRELAIPAARTKAAASFHKDDNGVTTAIRCSYFCVWLPAEHFGVKASANSGHNSMCLKGAALHMAQHATFVKAKDQVMQDVIAGELLPALIPDRLAEIEAARTVMAPLPEELIGFPTLEDLQAATAE